MIFKEHLIELYALMIINTSLVLATKKGDHIDRLFLGGINEKKSLMFICAIIKAYSCEHFKSQFRLCFN